jgi:hypothetical protein
MWAKNKLVTSPGWLENGTQNSCLVIKIATPQYW